MLDVIFYPEQVEMTQFNHELSVVVVVVIRRQVSWLLLSRYQLETLLKGHSVFPIGTHQILCNYIFLVSLEINIISEENKTEILNFV